MPPPTSPQHESQAQHTAFFGRLRGNIGVGIQDKCAYFPCIFDMIADAGANIILTNTHKAHRFTSSGGSVRKFAQIHQCGSFGNGRHLACHRKMLRENRVHGGGKRLRFGFCQIAIKKIVALGFFGIQM